MGTVTIDVGLKRAFLASWKVFLADETASVRRHGGVSIQADPVQEGPTADGRIVFRMVPSAFIDYLRARKFNGEYDVG